MKKKELVAKAKKAGYTTEDIRECLGIFLLPDGTVNTQKKLERLVRHLEDEPIISFDTETDTLHGNICGLGFYLPKRDERAYIPFKPHGNMSLIALDKLQHIFEDDSRYFIGHNIKYDMAILKKYGVNVAGKLHDTFVSSWMVNENEWLDLKSQVLLRCGHKMVEMGDLLGKGAKKKKSSLEIYMPKLAAYCMEDAYWSYQLNTHNLGHLESHGLSDVYENVYMPLVRIIYEMEQLGIKIDRGQLKMVEKRLEKLVTKLTAKIYDEAHYKFNINSTQQLGEVLFKKMKLPIVRMTDGGKPSTDGDTLEELSKRSKICKLILKYRGVSKLLNTYAIGLVQFMDKKDRVHTSFKIGGAVTGRLSSSEPNLQNIPIRSELGKEIRKCFIAKKGYKLIVGDYANIELRILAHYSQDKNMCDSFRLNEDLHTRTAAEIFSIPAAKVTKDQRAIAKTMNFGLMYGMHPGSLAHQLDIPYEEAKAYYNRYFEVYEGIPEWKEKIMDICRRKGFVKTIAGRRRNVENIVYTSHMNMESFKKKYGSSYSVRNDEEARMKDEMLVKGRAERQSVNSKIQGSASDIIMLAMKRLTKEVCNKNIRLLLQVHDELVFEVREDLVEDAIPKIKECMEHPRKEGEEMMSVPTIVEITSCDRWGDAK